MPSSEPGRSRAALLGLAWLIVVGVGRAQADDKDRFSLFDPTPVAKLRDFNPDRPGLSHDPTTVDAGHVQVEVGAFEHVFDPRGPSVGTTRQYTYGDTEFRLGLTNDLEFQVTTPMRVLSVMGGSDPGRAAGFGDTMIGAKLNLIGNDRGASILALLPILKVPTAPLGVGNGHTEFVLYVPYNYMITRDLLLTVEPSAGVFRSNVKPGYRDGYGFILGLDQTIAKVFIASVEIAAQASTERKDRTTWTASPSLAYTLGKNVQFDAGVYLGLNKATPRYNPYLGVSARF